MEFLVEELLAELNQDSFKLAAEWSPVVLSDCILTDDKQNTAETHTALFTGDPSDEPCVPSLLMGPQTRPYTNMSLPSCLGDLWMEQG